MLICCTTQIQRDHVCHWPFHEFSEMCGCSGFQFHHLKPALVLFAGFLNSEKDVAGRSPNSAFDVTKLLCAEDLFKVLTATISWILTSAHSTFEGQHYTKDPLWCMVIGSHCSCFWWFYPACGYHDAMSTGLASCCPPPVLTIFSIAVTVQAKTSCQKWRKPLGENRNYKLLW